MLRKASIAFAAMLVMSTMSIIPADAAAKISNGVACSKRNATVKVGGDTYRCTTNPTSTSKSLVWMSKDCLDANRTLNTANVQLNNYQKQLRDVVAVQVNSIILWSKDKFYTPGEIVYLADSTYYKSIADSKGSNPLENLGTKWEIYLPSANNPNIGTMPDPNEVILAKQKIVVDWNETISKLTSNIATLQAKTNQDAATKKSITTMQGQVNTLKIGIRLVNNRLKSLQASIDRLANDGAKDASAILLRSNIETAVASRTLLCRRGL